MSSNNTERFTEGLAGRKRLKTEHHAPTRTPQKTTSTVTPSKASKKRGAPTDGPACGTRSKNSTTKKVKVEQKVAKKAPVDAVKVSPSPQKATKRKLEQGRTVKTPDPESLKQSNSKEPPTIIRRLFRVKHEDSVTPSIKKKETKVPTEKPAVAPPVGPKRRRRRRVAIGLFVAAVLALIGYKWMPLKALTNLTEVFGPNETTTEMQASPQDSKKKGFFRKKPEQPAGSPRFVEEPRSSGTVDMSVLVALNM